MTISIARPNTDEANSSARTLRVAPADVWDLERRGEHGAHVSRVRTLDTENRKYGPVVPGRGGNLQQEDDGVESRREKAGATIMGALFGIALIVGSAFGGAFAGGDAGFVPDKTSQHMAAVIQ